MLLLDIGDSAGALPNVTPVPNVYGCWFPVPHEAAPVPTVQNLTATPVADGILLEWDPVGLDGVVYVIERSEHEHGPWIELARTENTHYLVSDPSGDTWYFRVFALLRGRAGDDSIVEGASKVLANDEDLQELIDKQKEIDEANLLERVELIDINAEEIIKEILRSHDFNDIRRVHEDTINRAVEDISLLETESEVSAQQIVDLFVQLEDETTTRQAQYQEVNEAIVDETSARVSALTDLHAQVTTDIGTSSAALNNRIDTVESDAQSALASAQTTLAAQITSGDNTVSTALNNRIDTVESDAQSALASAQTTLAAQITSGDNAVSTALHTRATEVETTAAAARAQLQSTLVSQIGSTQALLQNQINTKATPYEATVIAQNQVQAFQNGNFAILQQQFNVVASQHNTLRGQWQASYSVKLTGSTFEGYPVVAGFGLSADANNVSKFTIQAENFVVISSSASNGLELRNGYLRVFRGSTQRIIGNGFGQGGDLVDYFGPNVGPGNASKTNATMWMDASGNAMFKGKISAPGIVGQLQSSVDVYWTGSVDLIAGKTNPKRWTPKSYYSPLTTFTLPAPIQAGESHRPLFQLTVSLNTVAYGIDILIERKVGGAWVGYWTRGGTTAIAYIELEHRISALVGEQDAQVMHLGAATTQATEFRISAKCREAGFTGSVPSNIASIDTRVISVVGRVVGVR